MKTRKEKREIMKDEHPLSLRLKKSIIGFEDYLKRNSFFGVFMSICLLVIIGLLYIVFNFNTHIKDSNRQRDKAFMVFKQEEEILEKTNKDMYSERIIAAFTDEQLTKMKSKYTKYALYVNNQIIKEETSEVYSKTDKIEITFRERYERDAKMLFPEETLNRLSEITQDKIEKKILISTNEAKHSYSTQVLENGRKVTIKFDNVKPGEIISLDIQNKFAKELGLDEGSIEIFYNITDLREEKVNEEEQIN